MSLDDNRLWRLVKRISTSGLRDKFSETAHTSPPPVPAIPQDLRHRRDNRSASSTATSTNYSSPSTKPRILSRISSVGLLRKKPSLAFSSSRKQSTVAVAQPVLDPTIPTIPIPTIPPTASPSSSTPPPRKPTKYSISCIPIPSIPSMSIIPSLPSTPIKSSTTQISFSSSSSRPGTSTKSSISSFGHRISVDSIMLIQNESTTTKSRSSSLDLSDSPCHGHHTPTSKNSTHNSINLNQIAQHIVPPLELSATLNARPPEDRDDNRWGVEHVLAGPDIKNSSSVSLPVVHIRRQRGGSRRREGESLDLGLDTSVDKWDMSDFTVAGRSPEQVWPSLPVPPRKRTTDVELGPSTVSSPISSSPVYRGRVVMDDTPAISTFGRVVGRHVASVDEIRPAPSSPVTRASFSAVPDERRRSSLSAPRLWTKSLSAPAYRKNSVDVPTITTTTTTTPPRALGTLFRKLSLTGSPVPGRPSTASSVPSSKAKSWGQEEPVHPRKLLRKNSLKGRNDAGHRRPRTADAMSNGANLTEKQKREKWETLLERSEKAGGTIHLHAHGEGLLSDRMRMSMVSVVSGAGPGVPE